MYEVGVRRSRKGEFGEPWRHPFRPVVSLGLSLIAFPERLLQFCFSAGIPVVVRAWSTERVSHSSHLVFLSGCFPGTGGNSDGRVSSLVGWDV